MKLQLFLCVIAAVALCSSSENIKGQRSNTIVKKLLRNQEDNASRGRWFHKKGNQQQSNDVLLIVPNYDYTSDGLGTDEYTTDTEIGTLTLSPTNTTTSRAKNGDDLSDIDNEYEIENDPPLLKKRKPINNLKLKTVNGKKQVHEYDVPSKSNFQGNTPVSNSEMLKKGLNRFQIVRLNGDKAKRNFDNTALRRLFIQQ